MGPSRGFPGEVRDEDVFKGPDAEEANAIIAELDEIAQVFDAWRELEPRRMKLWVRGNEIGLTNSRLARHSHVQPPTLSGALKRYREKETSPK